MRQSPTAPADPATARRAEHSPAERNQPPERRPASKAGPKQIGAAEAGPVAGAVPTEKHASQSGSGWSDCSGIPPSTCEAANAAPQATPLETRLRQLPGSDLLRELLRYSHPEEGFHHDDRVRKPGRSTRAQGQAPGRRTSICCSWLSPASLGTGAVSARNRDTPSTQPSRRFASGRTVSKFGERETAPGGRANHRITASTAQVVQVDQAKFHLKGPMKL
jgi:hypothetical protein